MREVTWGKAARTRQRYGVRAWPARIAGGCLEAPGIASLMATGTGKDAPLPHHLRRIVHLHTWPRVQRLPRLRWNENPCILAAHQIAVVIRRVRETIA